LTDSPTAVVRWVSADRGRQEQACRSDAAAIDRLVDALERFRRCDVPAFECWFFAEFGSKYSELARRWAIRDFRKRMIDAIADEVLRHNVASHVAYRMVRLRHEEGPGWEGPADGPPPDSTSAEDKQADWRRPLEALFGDRDETYPTVSSAPEGSVEAGVVSERSRRLYRRLAAALHPDRPATVRAKFGALVDDFWFAVQRAYRLGDQAALERFAALVAVRTGCSDSLSQIPDLEPVRGELSVQRRRLEEALDRAQCSPAWQFATTLEHRPMLQAIKSAVRERLGECLAEARDEARALETQLRALARPPVTRPRRAVRGGLRRPDEPPTQLSFDF
jgi:hypothetical protein